VGPEHVGIGLDHWFGMPPYADLTWPGLDRRADDGISDMRELFWDEPEITKQDDLPEGEVAGLGTPAGMPLVTAALFERGFAEAEVAGVMGGNWMRVLEATWR
jgi:membrane dipeptidase